MRTQNGPSNSEIVTVQRLSKLIYVSIYSAYSVQYVLCTCIHSTYCKMIIEREDMIIPERYGIFETFTTHHLAHRLLPIG